MDLYGYCILEGLLSRDETEELEQAFYDQHRDPAYEDWKAVEQWDGTDHLYETLHGLLLREEGSWEVVGHPVVLEVVRHFVGDDHLRMIGQDRGLGIQQGQGLHQDVPLEVRVGRLTQRPSERELAVQRPRRVHPLDNVAHGGQHDRRQSGGLENVGERTHGTRAERSDRGEEDHVHPVGDQFGGAGRTAVQANLGDRVGLVAGEREVPGGHLADDPLVGQLTEAVDGIRHVGVDRVAHPVEVGAPVTQQQVPVLRRERPEGRIGGGERVRPG